MTFKRMITAVDTHSGIPMQEPVTELTLEAPAGLIRVRADCAGGKVKSVTFRNVPAFAAHLDAMIDVRIGAESAWMWAGVACSTSSPTCASSRDWS